MPLLTSERRRQRLAIVHRCDLLLGIWKIRHEKIGYHPCVCVTYLSIYIYILAILYEYIDIHIYIYTYLGIMTFMWEVTSMFKWTIDEHPFLIVDYRVMYITLCNENIVHKQ